MNITLSITAGLPDQAETTISVAGDVITIDGTPYDLSPVPEGGEATAEDAPFVGKIARVDGVIYCTVLTVLDDTAADIQPTDPAHWIVDVTNGHVTIPAIRKEVAE